MPAKVTVFKWIRTDADFANQYAHAREAQAEHYLDEIIQIADDSALDTEINPESGNEVTNHDVIQRAKLRVDTRKWAMSKLAPKKYGDRIENRHTDGDGNNLTVQVVQFGTNNPTR